MRESHTGGYDESYPVHILLALTLSRDNASDTERLIDTGEMVYFLVLPDSTTVCPSFLQISILLFFPHIEHAHFFTNEDPRYFYQVPASN